jgi:hypothetical protein
MEGVIIVEFPQDREGEVKLAPPIVDPPAGRSFTAAVRMTLEVAADIVLTASPSNNTSETSGGRSSTTSRVAQSPVVL